VSGDTYKFIKSVIVAKNWFKEYYAPGSVWIKTSSGLDPMQSPTSIVMTQANYDVADAAFLTEYKFIPIIIEN
jgi:hypothetical protein